MAPAGQINGMLRHLKIIALSLLAAPALAGTAVEGPAHWVDGDTLVIGGARIRLHGIDAVEAKQHCGGNEVPAWPCGAWVTGEVKARYEGRVLACYEIDRDRYARMVAVCYDGADDVGRALVRGGLAFAMPKYSDVYVPDERYARRLKAGLIGTGVTSPAQFRAAERRVAAQWSLASAPEGCVIKGNIGASGKRIYHMPGSRWYDETRISEDKGEQWFCSEDAARDAGWRAVGE